MAASAPRPAPGPIAFEDTRLCDGVSGDIRPGRPAPPCKPCPLRLRSIAAPADAPRIKALARHDGTAWRCATREADLRPPAGEELSSEQVAAVDDAAGLHAPHGAPSSASGTALPVGGSESRTGHTGCHACDAREGL